MKALILNSGIGSRLGSLTDNLPKALLKVGNKTILGRQLDSLLGCGITDIIITTGMFDGKIQKYVKENYPELNVSYVNNKWYRDTNYIYSIWLARELIDDDIILLHGDLVFEKVLLKQLIEDKSPNCVPVRTGKSNSKDFKASIMNNRINKIGVGVLGCVLAPIYKFSRADFMIWLNEIGKFINRGESNVYAEDAFNEISDKIVLNPMYFDNIGCMEIDTREDLKIAIRRVTEMNKMDRGVKCRWLGKKCPFERKDNDPLCVRCTAFVDLPLTHKESST